MGQAVLQGLVERAALVVLRQRLRRGAQAGEEEDEGEEGRGVLLLLLIPLHDRRRCVCCVAAVACPPRVLQPHSRQRPRKLVVVFSGVAWGARPQTAPKLRGNDEEEVRMPSQKVVGAVNDGVCMQREACVCTCLGDGLWLCYTYLEGAVVPPPPPPIPPLLLPSVFLPEPTAAMTRVPNTMSAELRTAQRGSRKPCKWVNR